MKKILTQYNITNTMKTWIRPYNNRSNRHFNIHKKNASNSVAKPTRELVLPKGRHSLGIRRGSRTFDNCHVRHGRVRNNCNVFYITIHQRGITTNTKAAPKIQYQNLTRKLVLRIRNLSPRIRRHSRRAFDDCDVRHRRLRDDCEKKKKSIIEAFSQTYKLQENSAAESYQRTRGRNSKP